jgi:ribonuclease P protein component
VKPAGTGDERPARFGFTVTKKIGNAVVRNRIRRRLREAVRLGGAKEAVPGTDYVLIGRRAALTLPFARLVADLTSGISALTPDGGAEHGSSHV